MELIVDGRNVAHKGSGHAAPGPPAVSGINPPTTPAGPPFTPSPFLYVAKTTTMHGPVSGQTTYKDHKICKLGTCLDVEAPGNNIAKMLENTPPNGADLVSKVAVGLAKVTGPGNDGHVKIGGAEVCGTGADVILNIPSDKRTVHQSQSKLLDGAGLKAAFWGRAVNPAVVVASGDPVALASGEVIDEVTDLWLPGAFPLAWKRCYRSGASGERGPLGRGGWTLALDQWIEDEGETVVLHDENGRTLTFPAVEPGAGVLLRGRGLVLTRWKERCEVRSRALRLRRYFDPVGPGGRLSLTAIRDDFGNAVELAYEAGRLVRVTDTARRELRITHDPEGRIARVAVWARGEERRAVEYGYTDEGELATVTNALGEVDLYSYDAHHRLAVKRLRSGIAFRYDYDPESGRCTRSTGPGRLQNVQITYESPTRVVVAGNPAPRELEFDEAGNLVLEQVFGGAKKDLFVYDGDGLCTSVKNAAGEEVRFEYDEEGRLIEQVGPHGGEQTFEYHGDLLVRTADGELVTTFTWDHRGAPASVTYPSGFTVQFNVDRHGRVTQTSGPQGALDAYQYDDEHNLVAATDARGARTRVEYDALGMPVAETDALGRVSRNEYDALGRPTVRIMRDGTRVEVEYDANDNIVRSGDGAGLVHEFGRWGTGVVSGRTMPDGQRWEIAHDVLERIREIKNPKGETYEYRFDRAGRVVEEKTFDGQSVRYGYSRRDLLARIDYDDETWIELDHDEMGRIAAQRTPHGDVTVEHDAQGRIVRAVVDEHGGPVVVELVWNERDQLASVIQNGREVQYTYDVMGRIAARTLPNGAVTRYFYDPGGALTAVDHGGEKVLLQRDVLGRERRRYFYTSGLDVASEYSDDDRLTGQIAVVRPTSGGNEPVPVVRRAYTYGPHARLIARVDSSRGATRYLHDALGLLVEARHEGRAEVYAYDAAGSLVHAGSDGGGEPWVVRMGNLLVRTERARFEYDARRRRRAVIDGSSSRTEYLWDCRNQLREVKLPTGVRVLFKYDAFGRRTRKSVITPDADPTRPPAVRTVDYVWDFNELALEIDSERGERVFVHERKTFEPILQIEGDVAYACLTDHIGVPKELIDAKGQVAWAADHTAWGKVTRVARERVAGDRPLRSPFALLGQYLDEETGLAYTMNRYFDSEVGRWLSPDPLGFDGGPNLYGFDGSPTERVDPLGLFTRSGFKSFLEKYQKKRVEAQKQTEAEQSAIGKPPKYVCGSGDSQGNRGRSGEQARPASDQHRKDDANIHAEEQVIRQGGGGRAIGAALPHCANCMNDVLRSGNVPSTRINPSWDPPPGTVRTDGGFRPESPPAP